MPAVDQKRFEALGQEWIARFDFNAICEIEDQTGKPFLSIVGPMLNAINVEEANDPQKAAAAAAMHLKMKDLRMILHEALRAYHPDIAARKVGEIISDIGMENALVVIMWAVMKGLGQNTDDQEGEPAGEANPPAAKRA